MLSSASHFADIKEAQCRLDAFLSYAPCIMHTKKGRPLIGRPFVNGFLQFGATHVALLASVVIATTRCAYHLRRLTRHRRSMRMHCRFRYDNAGKRSPA